MVQIAVPKETASGERRVALTPEVVGRLIKEGWGVRLEAGAGAEAYYTDQAYRNAGAEVLPREELFKGAQVVFTVQPLERLDLVQLQPGTIVAGLMYPHRSPARVQAMATGKLTALAMELVPRITRAQSMDVLSSQATVAGYVAALIAARESSRFFPMLTTAAGTIRPARVMVMGVGVAGLQAIATVRRLGANVWAYDVRKAAAEQALSLGAKVIELPISAEGEGGYARELTEEEKKIQHEALAKEVGSMDAVITTAQIPGRNAPILITKDMVERMNPGAVVVDLAAESGGNCELTQPGKTVEVNGVKVVGPLNLPSALSVHASEMYAKNLYNLSKLLIKDGQLAPDWSDEILAGALLTHQGEITHAPTKALVGGA
ncbi:MAG: Re/Si-specific NAD(P)(+) transhydrogenase subunit alpha [Meiothermus sp.]|uniref:Re/Si-specific NAD(P)(+) transhydrogenase subunit alpha n=1 Tax=Meiothermus sp. TaxID=1955249 RepID=UPI0025FE13CF|nr:Re/Si-specific NAD(P)(+) transhydrogenase subunit alpha [Meiothermus sp.]MCS7068904.1 Re/Si-specific NAD(P)(+) transhydrogenase subunit alpha [Meiothermus sp.]MCX7601579.1 Re/Si-specific NAD(P)(+) transhydrogenase subunit alpha [Meiothermus sp.]MDW8426115.1 Re/Si-specific NAD(P)(+) transhydrogenase subunit alpha [Meiothermus sp.]